MKKIDYDHSYKLLFSEPAMIKDLLTGFFDHDLVHELDFQTLRRLNKEYIDENLRERASDIVWKVQWKGQWLYLLMLIEFQSTIDPFMVVRMLSYISLIYQDIIKEDGEVRQSKQLPPVLPMILYAGEKPWNAAVSFSQLVPDNLPKILKKYQPDLECWLLDEGRYIIDKSDNNDNLVTSLVAIEQCQESSEIPERVRRLGERLQGQEFDSLRRAFAVYINRVLKEKKILPQSTANELGGVVNMLSRNIDIWKQKAIAEGLQEGMQQGLEQGLEQGRQKGEFAMLKRLLMKRFGTLSESQELILKGKSAEDLLELAERVLDAKSIEEIL